MEIIRRGEIMQIADAGRGVAFAFLVGWTQEGLEPLGQVGIEAAQAPRFGRAELFQNLVQSYPLVIGPNVDGAVVSDTFAQLAGEFEIRKGTLVVQPLTVTD